MRVGWREGYLSMCSQGVVAAPEVLNSLKLQLRSIWLPDEGQPEDFSFEASSLTGCHHHHHRHPHHLWGMRRVHHLQSRHPLLLLLLLPQHPH